MKYQCFTDKFIKVTTTFKLKIAKLEMNKRKKKRVCSKSLWGSMLFEINFQRIVFDDFN